MLFKNPRTLLSEAASTDLLENDLTNNVEEVKEEDKTTNGGIPVTTEAVALMESSASYDRARYLVKLEDVIAIKETEGEVILEDGSVKQVGTWEGDPKVMKLSILSAFAIVSCSVNAITSCPSSIA